MNKSAPEIVSEILKKLQQEAVAGVTTNYLNLLAEKMILEMGAESANKGYQPHGATTPFPATLCTSVNSVVAHGLPDNYKLQEGDLLNLDIGVIKDEECGDAAVSFGIGKISNQDERLLRHAKKALYAGIKTIRNGITVREVSRAIELLALRTGYVTNINLVGHAIGKKMHQDPVIPSFVMVPETEIAKKVYDTVLKTGMKICLEPQVTFKDKYGVMMSDGWTIRTIDNKNSAFFEHEIEVTDDGYRILTNHIEEDE